MILLVLLKTRFDLRVPSDKMGMMYILILSGVMNTEPYTYSVLR